MGAHLPGMRRLDLRHSRVKGAEVVRKAAYQADQKMRDELTGQMRRSGQHQERVITGEVMLPKGAPEEWRDREKLWNAVALHAGSQGRAAHWFMAPLPKEATLKECTDAVEKFAQSMVDEGCCADWSIHVKESNGNIHAHILVSDAPVDPKTGNLGVKSRKAYVCRNDRGEEAKLTAAEFKAQTGEHRFEKVYKWRAGGDKKTEERMTMREAALANENGGKWERVGKAPVDTKISVTSLSRYNRMRAWRKQWESCCNEIIKKHGTERVSCESYKTLGLEDMGVVPTRHEGHSAEIKEQNERILAAREPLIAHILTFFEEKKVLEQIREAIARARKAAKKAPRRVRGAWSRVFGRAVPSKRQRYDDQERGRRNGRMAREGHRQTQGDRDERG